MKFSLVTWWNFVYVDIQFPVSQRHLIQRSENKQDNPDKTQISDKENLSWKKKILDHPLMMFFQPRKLHLFITSFPPENVCILMTLVGSVMVFVAVVALLVFHVHLGGRNLVCIKWLFNTPYMFIYNMESNNALSMRIIFALCDVVFSGQTTVEFYLHMSQKKRMLVTNQLTLRMLPWWCEIIYFVI